MNNIILALIEMAHKNYERQKNLRIESAEIRAQIDAELKIHVEANRRFANGEKVNVYSYSSELIGQGIVYGAKCGLYVEEISIRRNSEPRNVEKDMADIYYRVFAIKKDGSKSLQHFDAQNHNMREGEGKGGYPYIMKITS